MSELDGPNDPEQLESEPEAPDEEEDFARMFEESVQPKSLRDGEQVEGKIVALGTDVAFVDVGGKGEATIELSELSDPEASVEVKVGDTVKAIVISTAGGVKLSHKLARSAATREALSEAFQSGLPVEGRVEKAIKGGFEIRFSGQRAFCPISQIDTHFTDDPSIHEGKSYTFRVTEFKQEGKNIVVSRRAILKDEELERAEEVRELLVPNAVLPGRVVSVRDYGAFVDLGGGIQGLLHISEMGWSRVSDATSVVQPGDEISVKVLRVDEEKGRISLGLKQLQADPWTTAANDYRVGQALIGRVTRVAEFGAFVELGPGIEALAHVSTFPPTGKTDGWKSSVAPGSEVGVEILSIDPERKRMGVAIAAEGSAGAMQAQRAKSGDIVTGARLVGKVKSHENYGVFVFLDAGNTGLIPLEETGVDRGGDVGKAFPIGSDVEVIVLEVDSANRRIRLSAKAVQAATEKGEARDYANRQQATQSESFGSLASTLRAAMGSGKK
jgi:small subunit ribosomal protein S1